MLPSRGIARLSPGLGLKSNILARVSVRSTSPHATSSARQFGTSLRSNGTILARARTAPLHPSSIVCAGILTSQSTLFSPARRRFASTDSTAPTAANGVPPAATDSEFSLNTNSFPELDDAALLDFPQQVGYLAQLGIDYGWGPTSILQWGLEHLHFTMGLPWWGSIVGLTIVTRLVLLWPVVKANEMSVRVREARKDPLYKATADKMLNSYSSGKPLSAIELQETRMQIAVLNQRMGIKSWMMFLPFIQIPFAFGGFRLMRAMAALPVPGLDTGGLLWISDLTVADPYFLMPLIATATMGASFKLAQATMPSTGMPQWTKYLPWVLCPATFLATMKMGACVQLLLLTGTVIQLVQTAALNSNFIRGMFGMRRMQQVQQTPTRPAYQPPRTISTTARERTPYSGRKATSSILDGLVGTKTEKTAEEQPRRAEQKRINRDQQVLEQRKAQVSKKRKNKGV